MTEELKEIGLNVGHRRVGRLMRQNGISVVRTRKHKVTTDSDHKFNIAPNLLDRDFTADASNQKWAGDISYVWAREGWLYLAVILDLHSRRVIGWAVSNRIKRDLAIRALKMAIAFRTPPRGCIHHTDRGSLLQSFAERDSPLDPEVHFQFLEILDHLVELGDRRAAALQISSLFDLPRRQANQGSPPMGLGSETPKLIPE